MRSGQVAAVGKKILVKGFVQGVSFRKQTQRIANNLRVRGWVRNLPDGNVEAFLEGEAAAVDALVAWCAFGPKRSKVDEVLVRSAGYTGRFEDFTIREVSPQSGG